MTLNIHTECKNQLKEKLCESLSKAKVNNNSFLNRKSLYGILDVEKILPFTGPIREDLEKYIGESPLFDFVFGYLSKEMQEEQKYDSNLPEELLTSIPKYKEPLALADRIVEDFDCLPWEYNFTFRLNHSITEFIDDEVIEITPDIRIIKFGNELTSNFPLMTGDDMRNDSIHGGTLLGKIRPVEWSENNIYVQVKANGFVGKYVSTVPESKAIDTFKSLLGLLIALRGLKVKHSYSTLTIKSHAYIHRNIGTWGIEDRIELADDVSKTLSDLTIDDLDGSLDSDDKKQKFINNRFELLTRAFSKDCTQLEKLRLAGRWLFDSYSGNNELLSFIQTTVSLEILLGEQNMSDLIGLGELLRNRCAYLIGKNQTQREKVLSDFKKIYDIRSKIVHSGKSQLSQDDRLLFYNLQWMANRVIQEEISLLIKNE